MKKIFYIIVITLIGLHFFNEDVFTQNTVYLDGEKKLYLIEDRVAVLGDADEQLNIKRKVLNSDSTAKIIIKTRNLTIWKITKETQKQSLKRGQTPSEFGGNSTQVFKDSSGRIKVIPGNLIIVFKKEATQEEIDTWFLQKGYEVIKKISSLTNSYVVKSSPGLLTLELAEQLRNDMLIRKVYVNYWTSVSRR